MQTSSSKGSLRVVTLCGVSPVAGCRSRGRTSAWWRDVVRAPLHLGVMAPPSDEVFPSIHFLGELGALLGRHGYTPAHVPVAHAVGQAIPELVAFLSAYRAAPPVRGPHNGDR